MITQKKLNSWFPGHQNIDKQKQIKLTGGQFLVRYSKSIEKPFVLVYTQQTINTPVQEYKDTIFSQNQVFYFQPEMGRRGLVSSNLLQLIYNHLKYAKIVPYSN